MKVKEKNKATVWAVSIIAIISAMILAISFAIEMREARSADSQPMAEDILEEKRYNFLVLGRDRASGLTDVIMLVSADIAEGHVNIIQIPRDTYARYSERGYRKLNGAMSYLGGGEALCDFLSEAMCIDIEGYFAFDLDAFVKAVDAIGGVEIDLPFDMDYRDPYQNLNIHLKAGRQTLDGRAAEQFVRYRSGYVRGDIGRIDAQKIFLSALFEQTLESMTPSVFVKTLSAIIGDVDTNISLGDITDLALCMFDIETKDITLLTLAGEDVRVSEGGAWFYVISKSSAVKILSDNLGETVLYDSFDKKQAFVNPQNENLYKIYSSDIDYTASSAEDINREGIEIQKY